MSAHLFNIDLNELLARESEQVEWKENVADVHDVVATLCAFANDQANLGGGYVVCGARETKDPHGFQMVDLIGLDAARFKEVEGRVISACSERVSPRIVPIVAEVRIQDQPDRRVLVFVMPASSRAHHFKTRDDQVKYYVRLGRETKEARNGVLRELLLRKHEIEPWDRRICQPASTNDLDLVALRDALQRIGIFDPNRGIDYYLSDTNTLSPFVPPLCSRDPLTGTLRPRNFAVLLFGRDIQRYIPGAHAIFSIYPGDDRSEPHAERHEIDGSLTLQTRRAIDLLGVQSHVAFDKGSETQPNVLKYPRLALTEAVVNAFAHRDYEMVDPTRITVFANRIEIVSPGALPAGVDIENLRAGRASPKWRNQTLAWFMNRLQLAQAEGQGVPTIIRTMRESGCPDPTFDANEVQVTCRLPAHPRHARTREYRKIEESISLGEFQAAKDRVQQLLEIDPLDARAAVLLADLAEALNSPKIIKDYLVKNEDSLQSLPPTALVRIADVYARTSITSTDADQAWIRRLFLHATKGIINEREARKIAIGLSRSGDDHSAVAFIDKQFLEHPDQRLNPYLLQARGNSYIGLAKQCTKTARMHRLAPQTRRRAWEDCRQFISLALRDLELAQAHQQDSMLGELIAKNMEFAARLGEKAARPNAATSNRPRP